MSEIVERLHKTPLYYGSGEASALGEQAADEIDRLTARVKALEEALRQIAGIDPWDDAEQGYVDKARAALTPQEEGGE